MNNLFFLLNSKTRYKLFCAVFDGLIARTRLPWPTDLQDFYFTLNGFKRNSLSENLFNPYVTTAQKKYLKSQINVLYGHVYHYIEYVALKQSFFLLQQ